ncbi:T9SS type A sorting domain-containing protein [Chryseobacterium sp. Tr-659]|uniref:chondroitinase family polysaccharide lyase n=1 Tax=Chryseobacterium sp. Tr-659 TaxID=2608340 RepID=UPI0014205F74|nr:chondroitinase family polysaccharide lyase [Chryseobacterium sp. Tr-659]NIF05810.1 T9SS type A sorting domain-containing protein [Chryseobacterium sp. Tr-659]
MSLRILLLVIILSSGLLRAQLNEINNIKTKYIGWLTDGTITTYSDNNVKALYNKYIQQANTVESTINSNYNFTNPGPAWDMTNSSDENAFTNLVNNNLFYLVMAYHLKGPIVNGQPSNPKYHSIQLKDLILKVFKYIKDKGVNSTTNFQFIVNSSIEALEIYKSNFGLRSVPLGQCILLMKDELVQAGEFSHHMGILAGLTSFIDPSNPNFNFTYAGFNTDVIRSLMHVRLCYILALDDAEPQKLEKMNFLISFINNALLVANGWADFIKPDFTTFHHIAAYPNSYGMDALYVAVILNYILKNTPYELSAASKNNIKNALMAYEKFSVDTEIHRGWAGRFPNSTTPLRNYRYAYALLYAADPIGNLEAGKLFKRIYNMPGAGFTTNLYLSLGIVNTMMTGEIIVNANNNTALLPGNSITEGQFGFPYGGLSVHKYNGYQVSVKGTSKHIWHYENSATENIFGRYISAGAMEILSAGSPKTRLSNGLGVAGTNGAVTDNGWDWSHLPGTTVASIPLSVFPSGVHRLFNGKKFLVHASLDNNGVFAMDYKDANSGTGAAAFKTVFFFKDKILCLGSEIKDAGGTYPIHTTLFQTGLPDPSTPTHINGASQTGLNVNFSHNTGAVWATDAIGNSFVVPANGYTGAVVIKRSTQQSRNHANTADTSGNYTTAYIDHGIAPSEDKYCYAIIMQGGANGAQDIAANFSNYFEILQQDNKGHMMKYVEDNIYAYAIFDPSAAFQYDKVISVDKPSVIMTQTLNSGNKLKVSLTNPLGLLNDNESYTYNQIAGNASRLYRIPQVDPVKLTIAGQWQLEAPDSNVNVSIVGNNTEVTFNIINGFTIQTSLIPAAFLGIYETKDNDNGLSVYPNPTKGKIRIVLKKKPSNLKIYDKSGKDVSSLASVVKSDKTADVDLTPLMPGIYTVCIDKDCKKVIKN